MANRIREALDAILDMAFPPTPPPIHVAHSCACDRCMEALQVMSRVADCMERYHEAIEAEDVEAMEDTCAELCTWIENLYDILAIVERIRVYMLPPEVQ